MLCDVAIVIAIPSVNVQKFVADLQISGLLPEYF